MRYVALLRGINVGGANKVSMAELKAVFEAAGMTDVRTYINSGNVLFSSDTNEREQLRLELEQAVATTCEVAVDIQLRSAEELAALVEAIPDHWTNGETMKCDVVFLQPDVDSPELLGELNPRPGVEDALYVPGALVWRVDRKDATRSRLVRIVGTPLYERVTVRNCNTARKLLALMSE
jgi:uncharacterized protein (DUF1697 family)